MKELSIEEKAKRYELALERCRKLYNEAKANEYNSDIEDYETIFPELAENEDERIRKGIIQYLEQSQFGEEHYQIDDDVVRNYIAWLEKQGELNEKPTKKQVWDYCNKISREWWQITMDKWETLTDEDKNKYNQFIGFNDFSDVLMNITAGALFQLIDTGKLEYEEGSLLLEKPDDTPKPLEVINVINKKQGEYKETLCDRCRREQPSHSCQDITELGRYAVEHEQKSADKVEPKFHKGE